MKAQELSRYWAFQVTSEIGVGVVSFQDDALHVCISNLLSCSIANATSLQISVLNINFFHIYFTNPIDLYLSLPFFLSLSPSRYISTSNHLPMYSSFHVFTCPNHHNLLVLIFLDISSIPRPSQIISFPPSSFQSLVQHSDLCHSYFQFCLHHIPKHLGYRFQSVT